MKIYVREYLVISRSFGIFLSATLSGLRLLVERVENFLWPSREIVG